MDKDSMYIFASVMLSNCLLLVMLVVMVYKARKSKKREKKRAKRIAYNQLNKMKAKI